MGLSIKIQRIVADTAVVLTVFISSFLTGVFRSMDFGGLTTALVLPNILLLLLAFMHLVLRKGRKYDESAHRNVRELFKTGLFAGFALSVYMAGTSAVGITPQSIIFTALSVILLALNIYYLAYRPHR